MLENMGLRKRLRTSFPIWLSLAAGLAVSLHGEGIVKDGIAPEDRLALQRAIEDLSTSFPARYPHGKDFLNRLNAASNSASFLALRREALTANPLVCGQPLLFVVRHQYNPDHHNTETMFQTGEINTASYQGGGTLKVIDFSKGGEVRTIVDPGPEGVVRDPDVYFDGRKILFSMRRNIREDYHLYEVQVDGSGLRQLTRAAGVFDIDPVYLPDDSIVFTSSREPKYCMCNRHIMGNLYRMEKNGANIHQIGKSTLFEGHATLMPDGRILYDRWEYVDRNFGSSQGLWTVNPDGTSHQIYWGNNTASPGGVLEGRSIPGSGLVLCTFSSCHDRPWGALAIIDRQRGVDGPGSVVRTWPAGAITLVNENGSFDAFKKVMPKYEDPYPLGGKYFLCSRMTGTGETMGIYLLDLFGNEILLHAEGAGCYDPMPIAARGRPPAIPVRRNFSTAEGAFYVQDVYQGTHMKGVKRGTVKFLRVVESPEKRSWTDSSWQGQGTMAPAMNWHDFNNKRILGTVPVAEDGSAYFAVPADTFVYFQLLDENGMMVQSMRSGTSVQAGERQGCVGCHESRISVPMASASKNLAALKGLPAPLTGWKGPARMFNYRTEVQPVFDRSCVGCHDFGKPAGKTVNLAGDRGMVFNMSYCDLWRKHLIKVVGAGPPEIQEAYSWGSHVSPLITVLRKGHHDVKLSEDELDRIITWVDINAPYYPEYFCAHPANVFGRSPLDDDQLDRLKALGINLRNQRHVTQVSFDRPEKSPCLQMLGDASDPRYKKALTIIEAGRAELAAHPEADAAGFIPCPEDQARNKKYERRRLVELRNRRSASTGERLYDE